VNLWKYQPTARAGQFQTTRRPRYTAPPGMPHYKHKISMSFLIQARGLTLTSCTNQNTNTE